MSYDPTVWVDGDHVTSEKLNKLEQGVNSMSYTPTVWNAGDVVTAEKLNKLEQGVADSGGGSSDFSTAEVQISNKKRVSVSCAIPIVETEYNVADALLDIEADLDNRPYEVILYKGTAFLIIDSEDVSVTGDIVIGDDGITVTGNGTITIN